MAEVLLADGRLDLLMDGFDELVLPSRRQLLRHLDQLTLYGGAPQRLLLSTRSGAYRRARKDNTYLADAGGIELDPLGPDEALRYLRRRRSDKVRWAPVAAALQSRKDLGKAFETPLMVGLADEIYNRSAHAALGLPPNPSELLAIRGTVAVIDHLLDGFLPARYPPVSMTSSRRRSWHLDNARRWLGYLAAALGDRTDLNWWQLRPPGNPQRRSATYFALVAAAIVGWTAVSAGLLNGWAFSSMRTAATDALRISTAALLCYLSVLALSRDGGHAFLGALGAYIAGVLSGSYDLAIVVGFIVAFSWPARSARWRPATVFAAAVVGVLAAGGSAAVRALDFLVPLEPSLIHGFGAGVADGFAMRWDGDLDGWLATGTVCALCVWTGLTVRNTARARDHRRRPTRSLLAWGFLALVVVAMSLTAVYASEDLRNPWVQALADVTTIGIVGWLVLNGVGARPGRRVATAGLTAVLTAGLGAFAYSFRTADERIWLLGLSEAVVVGAVAWLVLGLEGRRENMPAEVAPLAWLGLAAFALAVAGGAGMLDALAVNIVHGAATAAGTFLVLLVLGLRHATGLRSTADRIDPTEAGVFALVVVGLLAGMGYGLMYGLVAGLGSRVSADLAKRRRPGVAILPSRQGLVAGVLLGGLAVLAAAFNGFPVVALVVVAATSGTAGAFTFGVAGQTLGSEVVQSPYRVFRQDRYAFLAITGLVATSLGIAVGARTGAAGEPIGVAIAAALCTLATYGVTAGVVVASSATRYGNFLAARVQPTLRSDLPAALMPFLQDAYRDRQVLRAYGASYRFRHQNLQKRIADDYGEGAARIPLRRATDPVAGPD